MKEANLRSWHRQMGIGLALFLLLQGGTGVLLTMHDLPWWASGTGPFWDAVMTIHHGGGIIGVAYRLILAATTVAQIVLGVLIFVKMRNRPKKPGSKKR